MIKKIQQLIFLSILSIGQILLAQNRQEKKAAMHMEEYAYVDAISLYEHQAKKGVKSPELYRNLGDAYYFNGKLDQAFIWYEKFFELDTIKASEYYYRYAQALKAIGNYTQSTSCMNDFLNLEKSDRRALIFDNKKNFLAEIESNSGRYEMEFLPFNSNQSDYGTTLHEGKLVFSSTRERSAFTGKTHSWTGQAFSSLYQVAVKKDSSWGRVKPFESQWRTKFNESTPVFTQDNQTAYFTRNNYNKNKRGFDDNNNTLLKIYKSTKNNGQWSEAIELPFNSDQFSTAHPALTPDEKWLYFASNRHDNHGQSDLYKVAIHEDGTYGLPINLGDVINTEGRESFPFISSKNELYFSTDGRPGLGGLDIYVTKINSDGSFSPVQNIGAPANSSMDDFGFYIDANSGLGFLSSNRIADKKADNLYAFQEQTPLVLECTQAIKGSIYDRVSLIPLGNATVVLYDSQCNEIAITTTDPAGLYEFPNLSCGAKYRVIAKTDNYNTIEIIATLPEKTATVQVDFGLESSLIAVKKGDDLFQVLKLNPIYFDFGKADIREDAMTELLKVVAILDLYKNMKIEVCSHTDSRGNAAFNLKLSERRAKATVAWILSQGIAAERVSGKGYGQTQLINNCSSGIKCSEREHQENRRSAFIVKEL
ncbi:OmpA family protein [Flavobacterium sp. NKUCC04_CG]|uniref:OmpA family protein n=1 Tax=Flavobacterium sp. NKUCC04_CG TaxID=2842121 RepID=UPI001C5BE599|nr:OmpA family protein [Flavobacterium sp. NKUCC04_CG]MBW3520468.1 OmpA family protein [Flavobacterium sp. NKUCC04_CG]